MTALLAPLPENQLWSTMPGWGIVGDLTPPELIAARQLRVLRKIIVAGLSIVVALCATGYVFALHRHSSATSTLDSATARTTQLHHQANAYGGVTRMHGTVAEIQGQVAYLMKNDVDFTTLITKIRTALPASMSINSMTVTVQTATAVTGAAGTGLDTSGRTIIGTVAVSGSGRTLNDLPAYIDRLAGVAGVTNLVPTTNQASTGGAQFSLTFDLSDELFSHRYDVPTAGGK